MNILFFATSNFKPDAGGIAELGHQLASALTRQNHFITVLAHQTQQTHIFNDKDQNYKIVRLNKISKKYIEKEVSLIDYQVIFVLAMGSSVIQALELGKSYKIPVLLYVHGLEITKHRGNFISSFIKRIGKQIIINNCDFILCNSYYTMMQLIKNHVNPHKIRVLHPGITFDSFDGVIEKKPEKLNNIDDPFFLTIGRIIERKGIDTVIYSLPSIISKHPEIRYIIAGPIDSKFKEKLLIYAREQNVQEYIYFLGEVTEEEKKWLLSHQIFFIMPSRELSNGDVEGFGIVFLESALFAKPSIGGNSGGIPDAIVHNLTGFLVDPTSPEDISKYALMLLESPELVTKMGAQAKRRAIEHFNWDKQARLFCSFINNNTSIAQSLGKTTQQYYDILNSVPLTNPIDKIAATENLSILKDVLDNASIPFFLFFGTLLGAQREKDFIDHDYDTDIVVFEPFLQNFIEIIPELEQKGLILARTTKEDRIISLYRNGAYIDIYFAQLKRIGISKKWYIDYSSIKKSWLLSFIHIDFKGLDVLVPEKYEKILKRLYGKNWHIPKKDYEANPDYFMKVVRFFKRKNKFHSIKRFLNWKQKRK